MENNKQTAVEWLIEKLTPSIALQQKYINELKEQAKEMEKQQIMDAWDNGAFNLIFETSEQYYKEKHGKGNNDNTAV